jgi:hypothetical protein
LASRLPQLAGSAVNAQCSYLVVDALGNQAVKLFPWSLLWLNGVYYAMRLGVGVWAAMALLKGHWQALTLIPGMLRKRRDVERIRKLKQLMRQAI